MRPTIQTLRETLTQENWQALGAYSPGPFSSASDTTESNDEAASPFSPAKFFNDGFNRAWLETASRKRILIAYDRNHALGKGTYATVYDAISPEFAFPLALRISSYKPSITNPYLFSCVFAAANDGTFYSTLLPKAQMDLTHFIFKLSGPANTPCLPTDDETKILNIAISVVRQVYTLHERDITHGDVKPDNFMVMDINTNPSDPIITLMDPDFAETGIKNLLRKAKGTLLYLCDYSIHNKETLDNFALRRTLYTPANLEYLYHCKRSNCLKIKSMSREDLTKTRSLHAAWIIPDGFFTHRPHLKSIISTSKLSDVGNFSVGEILCALLLTQHGLFELFANQRFGVDARILPPTLTALLLNYQKQDPTCAVLSTEDVQAAIKTLAADDHRTSQAQKDDAMTFLKSAMGQIHKEENKDTDTPTSADTKAWSPSMFRVTPKLSGSTMPNDCDVEPWSLSGGQP